MCRTLRQHAVQRAQFACEAALFLALSAVAGFDAGCAKFDEADDADANIVTVGCTNDILVGQLSILEWQLRVVPQTIVAGESFDAQLEGVAVFPEEFLDRAQDPIPGGVDRVHLLKLNATVQVRSGATGSNVTLTPDESLFPYECFRNGAPCDPKNDLGGEPGARPNTDCEPQGGDNPCGRFLFVPHSSDCEDFGVCARRGKTGPQSQCDRNGFCVTDDLRIPLGPEKGDYTAEAEGSVFFGWADGDATGASLRESGPNEGTWILPPAVFESDPGPNSLRLLAGNNDTQVAIECTMGVDCRGPLGNDCQDFLLSPTPDSALISFPIEQP